MQHTLRIGLKFDSQIKIFIFEIFGMFVFLLLFSFLEEGHSDEWGICVWPVRVLWIYPFHSQ